jgi:hypothetical protein
VHQELPVILIRAAKQLSKSFQRPGIFAAFAPVGAVSGLSLWHVRQFGIYIAIIKKLVHGDFERAREFFQSFHGGYGVPVFNTGYVTAKQSSPFFNLTLREFFLLAQHSQSVANDHG